MLSPVPASRLAGLWLLVALVLQAVAGRAQEYSIQLEHWDQADGLPHRQVNSVFFDASGFMWLATPGGLCRYDGYKFVQYPQTRYRFPFVNLDAIDCDASGILWLFGNAGVNNVCLFDPRTGKVSRPSRYFDRHVFRQGRLPDGRILFATFEGSPQLYVTGPGGTVATVPLNSPTGWGFRRVTSKGTIWLNSGPDDMFEILPDGTVLGRWKMPPGAAYNNNHAMGFEREAYACSASGQLYAVSNDKALQPISYAPQSDAGKGDLVSGIGIDSILWRQGRLYHPRLGKLRDFPAEGWEDFEGTIRGGELLAPGDSWFGGAFGLYHLTVRRSRFRRYFCDRGKHQVPQNGYRGMLRTGNRLVAAQDVSGLFSQGLDRMDSTVVYSHVPAASTFTVLMWLADSTMLFASHYCLYSADKHAGNTSYLGYSGDAPVWCVYEWDSSLFLLGTEQGLALFDRRRRKLMPFTGYNEFTVLKEATINEIRPLPDGLLSICANNGLYLLDRRKGVLARYSDAGAGSTFLPASRFLSCTVDKEDRCWLATGSGLIRWERRRGTYRQYTREDGLSNNVIYTALPDEYGRLWLPSDYGLMAFDTATGAVETYFIKDGLSSDEFNRISHYRDGEGNLYFGSINGVTALHPADFPPPGRRSEHKPGAPLAVISFRQLHKGASAQEDHTDELLRTGIITIQPDDLLLTLEVALLNYQDPEKTIYSWQLTGLDTGWHKQAERTIQVGHLPYGQHRLRIRAQSSDGSWSRNELDLTVNVVRPFYLRAPFLVLMGLLAGGTIAVAIWWREYRLRRENTRLDKIIRQKTEDLQDSLQQKEVLLTEVHHRVKNNLQVISSLLRLQSAELGAGPARDALLESQGRVLSMALVHQQLYQGTRFDAVQFRPFADTLFDQVGQLFASQHTKFVNSVPEASFEISTAVPLSIILNELFTNSFKHAFHGTVQPTIWLTAVRLDDSFVLTYSDNGPGLPEAASMGASSTTGLKLIRILAKQLRGTVSYINDERCTFSIRFKA